MVNAVWVRIRWWGVVKMAHTVGVAGVVGMANIPGMVTFTSLQHPDTLPTRDAVFIQSISPRAGSSSDIISRNAS